MLTSVLRAIAVCAVVGGGIVGPIGAVPAAKAASEFPVNSYTTSSQQAPAIARLSNGDSVVVWHSFGQDGSFNGIYAQRFKPNATPRGKEFRVNKLTDFRQENSHVAAFFDGGFVVVWESLAPGGLDLDIRGQRFDAGGKRVGDEFRVNSFRAGDQIQPRVAVLGDGSFVVVWTSDRQDGTLYNVYAQRFSAAGDKVGKEFRVNKTTADFQWFPAVAAMQDGGFLVVWDSGPQDGSGAGVYGQRYSSGGAKVDGEFLVNTTTLNDQYSPRIAAIPGGGFVIVWTQRVSVSPADNDVYGQRYSAGGLKQGDEFRINTTTASSQALVDVAGLPSGGFIVVWTSQDQDGDKKGVYGQRYGADGAEVDDEFRINQTTADDQMTPAVAAFLDGAFVAVWTSCNQDGDLAGVYGRRFSQ